MRVQFCLLALVASLSGLVKLTWGASLALSLSTNSAYPTNSPAPIIQKCNNITTDSYIAKDTLEYILTKHFCPEASKQQLLNPRMSSILRVYNEKTPEEVAISIDWKNSPDFRLRFHGCMRFLRSMIQDGCNGNDPKNPMNWKAGGFLQNGQVKYRVQPRAPRHPAPKKPLGGCSVTHYDHYHRVTIWGGGWESADSGNNLKDKMQDCGLVPDTFRFAYGLGDGGREWNATAFLADWEAGCVADAAKEAGAHSEFECHQSD